MIESFLNYLDKSTAVTFFVLAVLSLYLIISIWIFIYRYFVLISWETHESESLESLLMGSSVDSRSFLYSFIKSSSSEKLRELFTLANYSATKESTKGVTFLAVIASTSPFIGLFGTVVSILETFTHIGTSKTGAITIIASGVSDALVATAMGIFVATFAYTFHQLLKRKAFEVVNLIQMQSEALLIRG